MMRRGALLGSTAAAALLASAAPARADPFSLTALVAGAISSATGPAAGGLAATALASITIGAVTIGAGYLLSSLFGPKPPKPENGTIAVQETIPYRIYGYGTAAIAGAVLHKESSGGFLGVVQALNAHPIDRFTGIYLNDDQVVIGINPDGTLYGIPQQGTDGRYKGGYINFESRIGAPGQSVIGIVNNQFAATWPATSTGQGLTLLGMVCSTPKSKDYQTIFPNGQPLPRAIVQQYRVFDPRDPSQDPNNPATWTYSDNAALCLLHWRCFSAFGSLLPYTTAILPNVTAWIEAANRCDDLVALKNGGQERRYRVGGYNTTEQDRRSTTAALLAACDGWMVDRGDGTVDIKVGVYYPPAVTLTDADILGFSIQRDVATKDKVNRVTARYTDPSNAYVSAETQPMDDTADQALRFGPIRAAQLDALWCPSTAQASRLQKREFIRQGRKTRGQLILGLSGLNAAFERFVLVQSNTIGRLANTVIEPSRPIIDIANQRVTINFVDSGPDIDTYDPSVDESPPPFVPTRPASAGLPIVQNVAVSKNASSSGGTTSITLTVGWDTPLNSDGSPNLSLNYIVQVRTAAHGSTPAGSWVQQQFIGVSTPGRTTVTTNPAPIGDTLDVDVIAVSITGQQSPESAIVQVGTGVAPSPPTGIRADSDKPGAIAVHASGTSGMTSIQFYRGGQSAAFGDCVAVGPPQATGDGVLVGYLDQGLAPGVYRYYATGSDASGLTSNPAGPAAASPG